MHMESWEYFTFFVDSLISVPENEWLFLLREAILLLRVFLIINNICVWITKRLDHIHDLSDVNNQI